MLYELHGAMLNSLSAFHASGDVIEAYKKRWSDTLDGINRSFPCPACFMAGVADSELKPLPKASGHTHYVTCKTCNREYSYEEAF